MHVDDCFLLLINCQHLHLRLIKAKCLCNFVFSASFKTKSNITFHVAVDNVHLLCNFPIIFSFLFIINALCLQLIHISEVLS